MVPESTDGGLRPPLGPTSPEASENIDRTSARYWLAPLQDAGLPIPATALVDFDHYSLLGCLEPGGDEAYLAAVAERIRVACETIGYPVFLRNDLTSAKHDGPGSYRIGDAGDITSVLLANVEDAELKLFPYGPAPSMFLVRAWIDVLAGFTAFGGLPIGCEWRLFANPEGVSCVHAYWPEDAIVAPDHSDYRSLLHKMQAITPVERVYVDTAKAAVILDGDFSVDWALDVSGNWWLIDVAVASESWHPDHDE